MASHQVHPLSTRAKLQLKAAFVVVCVETLVVALVRLLPRRLAGWPIKRTIAISFLRSLSWLPFSSSRNQKLPTGQAIAAYCKNNNLNHITETIASGSEYPSASLHFVDVGEFPSGPKLLLYFHGGAYVNPIDIQGQLPFVLDCANEAEATKLAVLEYTLAPELKYPGQLAQAVDALGILLQTYDPSQIILGGDSAGGNLLLALLAHIKQPLPHLKVIPQLSNPFDAAFIISPWVKMSNNSKSFTTYSKTDFITAKGMAQFIKMWQPELQAVWAEPLIGGSEFWHNLPVKNVLVTVGQWECFFDDVLEMGKHLGCSPDDKISNTELFVGEKEIHVQCAVDKAVGLPPGYSATKILSWLKAHAGAKIEVQHRAV